jgi:hypothetical protein
VQNSPTHDIGAYFAALNDEQAAFDDALAAIRDEQDEGRITAVQAAAERTQLLEAHLERFKQLRAEHLGEPS